MIEFNIKITGDMINEKTWEHIKAIKLLENNNTEYRLDLNNKDVFNEVKKEMEKENIKENNDEEIEELKKKRKALFVKLVNKDKDAAKRFLTNNGFEKFSLLEEDMGDDVKRIKDIITKLESHLQ